MYENMKKAREERGLSPAAVAKLLRISETQYLRYEGDPGLPASIVARLADFYGTSADYLLDRTAVREPR